MKIFPFQLSHSSESGYNRANITDESIIAGIINYDDAVLRLVYKEYHQKIRKMVYTFRNTTLDPDDIFQEGLTRAVFNIREGKFRGESSFITYLNSICRNICLKELAKKQTAQISEKDYADESDSFDFDALNLLLQIRNRLEEKCRVIIDLRFGLADNDSDKGSAFEDIAAFIGITPENARQRFKRCLDKLKGFILGNNDLKNLFSL